MPERGKYPPGMLALGVTLFRELNARPWRIFCQVDQEQVIVLAVLDGRRDMEELLQARLLQ